MPNPSSAPAEYHASRPQEAAFLQYQLKLLQLGDRRQRLGLYLLKKPLGQPLSLLFLSLVSLGGNYRPWAHARLFSMANYVNAELTPELLQSLRHPWHCRRYKQSSLWLWNLLQMVARKELQKAPGPLGFRLSRLCPPFFMAWFEWRLQRLLIPKASPKSLLDSQARPLTQGG